MSSSDEEVDQEFEIANAWRLKSLIWCKRGHCSLSTETIECFCCHKKALKYDECDVLPYSTPCFHRVMCGYELRDTYS